jgi:hypothetical protein
VKLVVLMAIDGGKQADLFGLALYGPDGSLFHATGPLDRNGDAQPVSIASGNIVNNLWRSSVVKDPVVGAA